MSAATSTQGQGGGDPITLSPCQSLALRRLIEAMKTDESVYTACPDPVKSAFTDFYLPPYSNAEVQIKALEDHRDELLRLIDKFAYKIHELEARLRSVPPCPV